MKDIFDTAVVCEQCNKRTEKGAEIREGVRLRFWKCNSCGQKWYHPGDLKEFEDFKKLRNRQFAVKLRMVGNSWAVSIPREIISFQEDAEHAMNSHFASQMRTMAEMKKHMSEQMNKMVRMCMESPGKLSLFFNEKQIPQGQAENKQLIQPQTESIQSKYEKSKSQSENNIQNKKKSVRISNKSERVND